MDEQAWLTSTDPRALLWALGGHASDRKLWLFACACARRGWHLLDDVRLRTAVEAAEQVAEGDLPAEHLADVWRAAHQSSPVNTQVQSERTTAARIALAATGQTAWVAARNAAFHAQPMSTGANNRAVQAAILRDIFGIPFRRPALDLAWRTPQAVSLALEAYDNRPPHGALDPITLHILADALEDAGSHPDLIDHLRAPGHVRGCWVLDLVLGRE